MDEILDYIIVCLYSIYINFNYTFHVFHIFKNIFKVAIMHSVVATHLENLNLLNYLKYTDANGVQRDLGLATWNGRLVLIDDNPMRAAVIAHTISHNLNGAIIRRIV